MPDAILFLVSWLLAIVLGVALGHFAPYHEWHKDRARIAETSDEDPRL